MRQFAYIELRWKDIDRKVAAFRASVTGEADPPSRTENVAPASTDTSRQTQDDNSRFDESETEQTSPPYSLRQMRPKSNRDEIRDEILRQMRPKSNRDEIRDEIGSAGEALLACVVDPWLKTLNCQQEVFLAPDGDLTRLPFEALPLADKRRLIDICKIHYVSVGREVLTFDRPRNRQSNAPVVIADPDFNLSATPVEAGCDTNKILNDASVVVASQLHSTVEFEQLEGTRQEGIQVAKLLGVEPLLGSFATDTFLKNICSPQILHIASHGFFLPDQRPAPRPDVFDEVYILEIPGEDGLRLSELRRHPPTDDPGVDVNNLKQRMSTLGNPLLRSGLVLAGANSWLRGDILPEEVEDGILTAVDVAGLDLSNTELVVLSACETGLGEVNRGEGVFGLRRAFVLAGAKTLVMSLWKVPDQQTQELMQSFYHYILSGQSRAEALRQAQLALRSKYPDDPFYWAGFICQGDPGPLPRQEDSPVG